MEMNEEKSVKVTYQFSLPEHRDELEIFQSASKYYVALWDIHNACRNVWKYQEGATDQEVALAEKINDFVIESGALDT